ncbi:MAG: threonine aldolase family protein, partial [Gaiellaceae bacterium]
MIDLRSDTVTKPTPGMLAAMAAAEVGDEQEREDPTTNELQRRMAGLLGHEAALFLPTATMANQAALRVLSRPGCKVVAEERTHVLIYEWGGPAIHSGLVMQGLVADAGRPTPEQIEEVDEFGPGSVLVLENTHRSSGGRIWPLEEFRTTVASARSRGVAVHLDGARLFNASVAAGIEPSAWGSLADTVTICFSKGLGCPFGAILAGSEETIERAWEGKFLFGG